jgi:Pyruvate/2-oxoacid:ferredoxin oxidoreductase delta subunit
MQRTVIEIDEALCDGCGQCVTGCAEGALAIVEGKAKLVSDTYCDGLGACLGHCPQGAIRTVVREAADFDQQAVDEHLAQIRPGAPGHAHHAGHQCPGSAARSLPVADEGGCACAHGAADGQHHHHSGHGHGGGCPSSAARSLIPPTNHHSPPTASAPSALSTWPVQLALVPPQAPFLKGADLLLCADCVPFAMPDFHARYLKGRVVLVGCPKLDNLPAYTQKLAAIYAVAQPRSVTVLRMEVPCCAGLAQAAMRAKEALGSEVPLDIVIVGIDGEAMEG